MAANKIKVCSICKKEIKRNDNYCHLIDYKTGKFFAEGYYHTLCYTDKIQGVNPEQLAMKKSALLTLDRLNKILDGMGVIKKEYEIQ